MNENPRSRNENLKIRELEPQITEEKLWNMHNLFLSFFIIISLIILTTVAIVILDLSLINSIILTLIIIVISAVTLFFLLEPRILKKIERITLHTIEKPVIKEVPVEKEVFIEKPVIKEVYIPEPKKESKPAPPKYDFIGSTETKTYHKRDCRFGKLIKKKYKLLNNSEKFFTKRGFKPCKVCITKEKKA